MITSSALEERRSPSELREFVIRLKQAVQANKFERHRGHQKKGLYKQFLEELIPLSCFATQVYPDSYKVQPVLGNQGYDALVWSEVGEEVDRVEITSPHDGAAEAEDLRLVVDRGYGQLHIGTPGEDFEALFPHVLAACRKKAKKDYGGCTLVVAIAPIPPFASLEDRYEQQIEALVGAISRIRFKARRVFLVVLPDRVIDINA